MSHETHWKHILLADDDKDDTTLFQEVLEELSIPFDLEIIDNGEKLIQFLTRSTAQLPDILFLDLNMPRKNGFECLSEIKRTKKLKKLPVIIFTTSFEAEIVRQLYREGAQYYIRKPNNFRQLKEVIQLALTLNEKTGTSQPSMEQFVLSSQSLNGENE